MRLTRKTSIAVILMAGFIGFAVFASTMFGTDLYRKKGITLGFTKQILLEDNVILSVEFEKAVPTKNSLKERSDVYYMVYANIIVDDSLLSYKYLNVNCIGLRTRTPPIFDFQRADVKFALAYRIGVDIETEELISAKAFQIYWASPIGMPDAESLEQYLREELELYNMPPPYGGCGKILSNGLAP